MRKIIGEVFLETVRSYESILKRYYPAHGSNGFTERNLTFNFCHQYLNFHESKEKKNIIIWQEVPIDNPEYSKRNNHFDSLIIDTNESNETIFFIEAKRIRNINQYQSLQKDFKRIQDCFMFIPDFEKFQTFRCFAILLADIWTFNDDRKDNRLILKKQIEEESGNLFQKVYTGENETYSINYQLHTLKKP